MKKELPRLYKNDNICDIKNNKKMCYAGENTLIKKSKENHYVDDNLTVEEKLKKLFRSSRYIFNIGVIIETKRNTYDTKIAGQVKNSIVTVEGEVIPIIEIKNIIIKDRL